MQLVKRKKPVLIRKSATEQIKKESKTKIKVRVKESIETEYLIPTSSTLLNCACSDNPLGGYGLGKLVNLIGDSSSGKSLLALSCFAEMSMFTRFDDYDFYYDDVEAALEFNMDYLFGHRISDRIDMSIVSDTIQDFYGNIVAAIQNGKPFIYILDSLDALTSIEERKRAKQMAKESGKLKMVEKDEDEGKKKPKGSYKMEKAKMLTEVLRVICRDIKDMEALVIIISQTRDNVGFGFTDKTRSGGRALKFYSTHELWLSILKSIPKLKRIIGVNTKAKVAKNKLTGKVRNCTFPIFYDYGVDDLTANVDFLLENGIWKMGTVKRVNPKTKKKPTGRTIHATHFKLEGTKDKIINQIELRSLEKDLQLLVGETWNDIEEKIRLDRKPKYA